MCVCVCVFKVTVTLAYTHCCGFPGSSVVKNPPAGAGNMDPIPLQYSCLENPMDRGAWRAIVHGARKSQTLLSSWHACTLINYLYEELILKCKMVVEYILNLFLILLSCLHIGFTAFEGRRSNWDRRQRSPAEWRTESPGQPRQVNGVSVAILPLLLLGSYWTWARRPHSWVGLCEVGSWPFPWAYRRNMKLLDTIIIQRWDPFRSPYFKSSKSYMEIGKGNRKKI